MAHRSEQLPLSGVTHFSILLFKSWEHNSSVIERKEKEKIKKAKREFEMKRLEGKKH